MLPYSNGSPWLIVTCQKSNLTFGGVAVAFLMFMFLNGLYNANCSNDDADNRYYNADNAYYCF